MPTRAGALALALCVALAAIASSASAQTIGPGHEQAVLGLFSPHELGDDIAAGFVLWNVAIEPDHVIVTLRAEEDRETTLTLLYPDDAPDGAARTTSFAITTEGASDAGAQAARRALLDAIRRNDHGGFWDRASETITNVHDGHGGASIRSPFMWTSGWVPVDGIAVILLIYVLALLLAVRLLADAPRWMGPALGATVVAGALVRLALAPASFLGAWPWSRLYPHIREVAYGTWLAALADHVGHPFHLTDVAMWTNYAYAVAMPLVLFSHATYLLRDPRAGLAASFAMAFLPQHIRFSRCEDGFVASLVLTSLALAVIHGWLRDRSRVVRWLLLAALPIVLYPGYLLRPLNLAFVIVYAFAILALHRETAPRWRRGVALAIVLAVCAASSVQFLEMNAQTVGVAVSGLEWLGRIPRVLVSPSLLVLSDPSRTPPVLILLAVAGGVLAWRAGERWLVAFLCGWLLLFVSLHAFVVQESMEPRYHLHLVVPFLLLGAIAVPRLAERRRAWIWGGAAVLAVSPWLHYRFVTDVDYAQMREYELVRRARDVVPEGCTILEFTGGLYEVDELRFSRIGALAARDRRSEFHAIGVFSDGRTRPEEPTLEQILEDPPRCLYFYEGLACTAHRGRGEAYAGTCSALRERLHAEPVLRARAPARFYDVVNMGEGEPRPSEVPLRLSRVPVPVRDR